MKRKSFIAVGLALCFSMAVLALAGCGSTTDSPAAPPVNTPAEPEQPIPAPAETPDEESPAPTPAETSDEESPAPAPIGTPDQDQTATLYVGTKAGGFTEYPLTYDGELTPEILIQGIAELTGWDLTLAEPVISGKGGMSVCLANTSSLFVGPPDPQKDAFHMYDAGQLAETVLDSIQKTLQEGFTGELGDPDTLDIWYFMEGERPLELPDIGRSWPIDQPYQWAAGESYNQ